MINKLTCGLLLGSMLWLSSADAQKSPAEPPQQSIAEINKAASVANEFKYPINQTKLDNGLNVVTVPFPSPGIISFFIVVRTGSRNEIEKGKTGFAHFFEHMMFRGTELYPKEKYAETLKSTGASANANTSLDRTVYHMTGASSKLETMFMLEADRFKNLSYSISDFKTEAGAVKGEYTKNSANPYTKLNELIQNAAFDTHTYKHTTMGFFDDIVDMPNQYEYSREFFNRYYRPEYCTIIVVGDATQAGVDSIAKKYFGDWKHGSYESQVPEEPVQNGVRYAHLQKAGFPPFISLNYKAPAYHPNEMDLAGMDLFTNAYFGENSELYEKLVVKEQIARSLGGDATLTRDPFLISFEASVVSLEKMDEVKQQMTHTIEMAKTTPIDQQLLQDVKANFINSMKMRLDNPTAIAQTLSMFTWVTGDPNSINDYFRSYQSITAQDLMNIAKKHFTPFHLTIGTIDSTESTKK